MTNLSASQPRARTAIVYGPIIYGLGSGPVNQRSIQLPSLARATLQNGYAPHVGKGLSAWSNVHVSDIAQLVLKLVAASQDSANQNPLWNKDGIYFADAGKIVSFIPSGGILITIFACIADAVDSHLAKSPTKSPRLRRPRASSNPLPSRKLMPRPPSPSRHTPPCCWAPMRRHAVIVPAPGSDGRRRAQASTRRLNES